MRPGEVDGRDYHFVTPEKFEEMVRNHEFAEHAFVHRNRYGTAESAVEAALSNGKDMIFDVDWQGGQALSTRWPHDSLKIFILPPDLDTLANRLRTRATDDPKVMAERLSNALGELEHFGEYPHVIVNDDLERAYAVLRAIYLTRKYGDVDRPDVPFPLAEMAKLVKANDEAKAHAGRLLGR
jgi:guanylate kinase